MIRGVVELIAFLARWVFVTAAALVLGAALDLHPGPLGVVGIVLLGFLLAVLSYRRARVRREIQRGRGALTIIMKGK